MLRGDKPSRSELQKQVEEQRRQLIAYERKLKDVVRAYKGLNSEKEALQATVEALTLQDSDNIESTEGPKDVPSGSNIDSSKKLTTDGRVETLKRSLATLTAEKNRRETAFQADKKALLLENETLKERIEKAANETEAQAETLEQRMKELRIKMKRIEEDRERELLDHGSVLAEMQQRFARERANCEQMERQMTELYKKLHHNQEKPHELEMKLDEVKSELKAANQEASFWKKKADKTPTVQMLQDQLNNLKVGSELELAEVKSRISSSMNLEREARLHELEERLREMSSQLVELERSRIEGCQEVERLREMTQRLQTEKTDLTKELESRRVENSDDVEAVRERFAQMANKLRFVDGNVNFYELLKLEEPSLEQKRRYEYLQEEFERYKLKAEAVLKSRNLSEENLSSASMPRAFSQPLMGGQCATCSSKDVEMRHLREVIASLHNKLHNLQIDHSNANKDHIQKCEHLQTKIVELQATQANTTNELRQQMQQKVCEVEEEMQKQRTRTLEVLAEKEKELEVTKTILVSIRSRQMNGTDPMDPPQISEGHRAKLCGKMSQDGSETQSVTQQHRRTSHEGLLNRSMSASENPLGLSGVSSATEARNIHYEQQVAQRDRKNIDLRNALEISETNMREIQQASLTKDLQHYEMIEKLKDEIRILEGKLKFYSGDANLEYLRNVFVQLLHCESSSGRRHILKAIGTVLKLSTKEMKSLDKHAYW